MKYGTVTKAIQSKTAVDIYVDNKLVDPCISNGKDFLLARVENVPIGSTIKFVRRKSLFSKQEILAEYVVTENQCVSIYEEIITENEL